MTGRRRNLVRSSLFALSFIPLAVKVPYLWQAWVSSPIDRAHLKLYGVLSLVAVGAAVAVLNRRQTNRPVKGKSLAAALLGIVAVLYAIGLLRDVNALQLLAAIGVLWTTAWLLFGHKAALLLAPAALLAMLAVPGTLYWMRNISAAYAIETRAAFTPTFTPRSQPGMLGREVPTSPGFTRFFRTSDAHQFTYADVSNSVTVLAVTVGDDIHEIHPATHCLRSGGWSIESENIVQVEHPQGGILEVDEAVVDLFERRMLVWVWYSSDKVSTGSFLHFRRMYSASGRWRTYQVATSVGREAEGLAVARRRLQRFLAKEARQ